MKKSIFILLVGIVGVALILFFRPKPPVPVEPMATAQLAPTNPNIGFNQTNAAVQIITQTAVPVIVAPAEQKLLDATKAQSIADWTNAVPDLKLSLQSKYLDSWIADKKNPTNYFTLLLTGKNGVIIQYKTDFITILVKNDQIQRIELQTTWMNIDETRKFGLQLCNMLEVDPKDFLAWCDQVGNHWLDAPLFNTGNKLYGFGIHRTYNDEKSWFINFVIQRH